jgi:hypothetical protein
LNQVLNYEPIWSELLGQPEAVAQLRQAVADKDAGLQHAWLITGPPGSGRSNAAAAFAATFGAFGVASSALSVGLYQGAFTALGFVAGAALSVAQVDALTAVGGVLLIGVGMRLLGIKQVKVADLLPALLIAPLLVSLLTRI